MPKWGDQFQKLQKLGEGSSAQIYLVQRKDTKQKMAAKIMKNIQDQPQIDALEMEIKILTNCKHPNIIKCHSVQMFEGELWILMEYCEDGSLADIMNFRKATYSQAQICNILKQILEGLKYLHENNIIHRDIKAGNILHQQGTIKIADFGISIISKGNAVEPKFSRIGSPFWMSPEILSQSIYNTKSDIWALGITAIELAQGEPPYSHQHPFRAIYSIQTHPPQGLKQPQKWSKQFNDFVRYCLTIDYKSRPTAKQLLRHPFLKKGYRIQQSNEMSSQSMSIHHESVEDTIIMYDQQPLSIWQKGSFPQTEQKNGQLQNTVVIKESIEQSLLFSELKNQQQRSGIKESLDIQNKGSTVINNMSLMQRQQKVKQLYLMMEEQIGSVRRKYIQKISQLYVHDYKSNQKEWHSPIKKLKQRSQNLFNNQHARSTSQVFKKML